MDLLYLFWSISESDHINSAILQKETEERSCRRSSNHRCYYDLPYFFDYFSDLMSEFERVCLFWDRCVLEEEVADFIGCIFWIAGPPSYGFGKVAYHMVQYVVFGS